jgi:hypothetical protein
LFSLINPFRDSDWNSTKEKSSIKHHIKLYLEYHFGHNEIEVIQMEIQKMGQPFDCKYMRDKLHSQGEEGESFGNGFL